MTRTRKAYTYTFHVPDTPEYAELNRLLQSPPYPGGIQDRSKFIREVLMDALGLRRRPWAALTDAGPRVAPEEATARTPAPSKSAEAVLARGLSKLRAWEGDDADA